FLSIAEQSSGEARETAVAKALDVAQNLPEGPPKARALMRIARELPDDRMRPVVRNAAGIPGGILAAGELGSDVEVVELLGVLAQQLEPSDRKAAVDEAHRLAHTVAAPYSRARALAGLLPSIGAAGRPILDSIKGIAQTLKSPDQRAE